jgi:hypothetical protein
MASLTELRLPQHIQACPGPIPPMRPNPLPALLLAIATAFLAAPARAEWREVPYADLARMPLILQKVDHERVYDASYMLQPGEGQAALPADLQIQVRVGELTVPVAIEQGRLRLPVRQDWVDAGAQIRINQPRGRIRLAFNMNARTPAGTEMSYARLSESAAVMERGIAEAGALARLFAPDVEGLELRFQRGPQTATLTWPDGRSRSYRSDAEGRLRLPWEADWGAARVRLSAPLASIGPVLD